MVTISIIPATMEHAEYIAANAREADVQELHASSYQTPLNAMKLGMDLSDFALTGCVDGEPVMMWGVYFESLLWGIGTPWMVATKQLDKFAMVFLRRCRDGLLEKKKNYGMLVNYVDARNVKAIRWLKWLGFNVEEETKPYGALKLPFHRFTMV